MAGWAIRCAYCILLVNANWKKNVGIQRYIQLGSCTTITISIIICRPTLKMCRSHCLQSALQRCVMDYFNTITGRRLHIFSCSCSISHRRWKYMYQALCLRVPVSIGSDAVECAGIVGSPASAIMPPAKICWSNLNGLLGYRMEEINILFRSWP